MNYLMIALILMITIFACIGILIYKTACKKCYEKFFKETAYDSFREEIEEHTGSYKQVRQACSCGSSLLHPERDVVSGSPQPRGGDSTIEEGDKVYNSDEDLKRKHKGHGSTKENFVRYETIGSSDPALSHLNDLEGIRGENPAPDRVCLNSLAETELTPQNCSKDCDKDGSHKNDSACNRRFEVERGIDIYAQTPSSSDYYSAAPKRDRYYQPLQGYMGESILSGYPYFMNRSL